MEHDIINIGIDAKTCVRCGHCVAVCPAYILRQPAPRGDIDIVEVQRCIECGQCAAICPTDALVHGSFAAETLHRVERKGLPTAEEMLALMRVRRSNRAFTGVPPTDEELRMVVEAAGRAPTSTNSQRVAMTVVRSPDVVRAVADYTMDCFASAVRLLDSPVVRLVMRHIRPDYYRYLPEIKEMVANRDRSLTLIMHDAPMLVFFHSPKGAELAAANCNLAYQNASLMAETLGLGHFYLGFVISAAAELDHKGRLGRLLGTTDVVHAGMALGKVRFRFTRYPDRRDIVVREV